MFGWIWSPPPLVILTCHLAPDLPHMVREKRHTWLGPSDQAGCWGKSGQEWWWVGAGLGRGIWSRPPCEPWPEHCCCCCPVLHHHPHHPLALLPHLGSHNADHLLLPKLNVMTTSVPYMLYTVHQILSNNVEHSSSDIDHLKLMQAEIDCLGNFDFGKAHPIRASQSWG